MMTGLKITRCSSTWEAWVANSRNNLVAAFRIRLEPDNPDSPMNAGRNLDEAKALLERLTLGLPAPTTTSSPAGPSGGETKPANLSEGYHHPMKITQQDQEDRIVLWAGQAMAVGLGAPYDGSCGTAQEVAGAAFRMALAMEEEFQKLKQGEPAQPKLCCSQCGRSSETQGMMLADGSGQPWCLHCIRQC